MHTESLRKRFRRTTLIGVTLAMTIAAAAPVQASPYHSHEADNFDERIEGTEARKHANLRLHWRSPDWKRDPQVEVKILGINDFHGQLSPRSVGTRPAGGAAVLAAYLKEAGSNNSNTLLIHAGDHVGATPPNSALLQDEPAISLLNQLANRHCLPFAKQMKLPRQQRPYAQLRCNVVGTLGNHEFDEGRTELLRLLTGGNHANGPFLDSPWRGARFPVISANVIDDARDRPLLPPYTVRVINGVRVGIIGAVLKETPTIVTPTGIVGLDFVDEATAINAAVKQLKHKGIRAIVVTIHQGIRQTSYEGPTDDTIGGLTGPLVDIVQRLDDEVDVVVSGHAHGFTNALINNASGKPMLVTQAFSAGTAYGDIDLVISRRSGDVVEKSAAVVTTWGDAGPGLTPDSTAAELVAAADARVAPLVMQTVGVAQEAITRVESAAGESALGNLIADAQRASTGALFSFMNPGGIRADLDAGEVTWGELFTIQPFSNDLVSMDLSGAQIKTLLEQQWLNQSFPRLLKTSGLTYTWDANRAVGDRVVEIVDADGNALDPLTSYRVTVNSFIATGGDNFTVLNEGTNRVVGLTDLDALIDYVEGLAQPFGAVIEGRIVRLN